MLDLLHGHGLLGVLATLPLLIGTAVQTVIKAATGGINGATIQASTVVDVNFTATGDKSVTINHGLAVTPVEWTISPNALTFYKSALFKSTLNTTSLVLTKVSATATTGSMVRVIIKKPHSFTQ